MSDIVRDEADARRRESLASLGAIKPAKAQLKADRHAQGGATPLREIAAEALRRTMSQKAAAADIGIHEGRLSHKLKDGSLTLAQLERLGPEYALQFALDVLDQLGQTVKSPKERARERIPEVIQWMLEITA